MSTVLLIAPGLVGLDLGAEGLTVVEAKTEAEGLARASEQVDAVLLAGPWAALVPRLREVSGAVVVLLGCDDEACVDSGVSHGADDFVSRASGAREIALRLRVLFRRNAQRLGFDAARGRFRLGQRELDLSATEQALFSALFEHTGFVCTRAELTRRVWGDQAVHSRTLDNHVMRLREKLGTAGRLVESVRGVGYRLSREALP